MNFRTLACVLLLTAALCSAVQLTGRVVDRASNAGVDGVSVEITGTLRSFLGVSPFHNTVRTDALGSFRMELPAPAELHIRIKADGYSAERDVTDLSTKPGAGPLTVTLIVSRHASIAGRVVDWETGKPLAHIPVGARRTEYIRGRREVRLWDGIASTDADGQFVIRNLLPADYVLEVNLPTFDAKDSRPREGYPRTFWPGAGDLEGATPFTAASAALFDAGAIRLRRRELPSVTVKALGGNCAPGQAYDVELMDVPRTYWFTFVTLHAPCGESVKLQNANPGEYLLLASAPWQPEDSREKGAALVQIADRDLAVDVPVTPPLKIHGRVTLEGADAADRRPPLPRGLAVKLWPRGSKNSTLFISPITSAGDQKALPDGSFDSWAYVPPGGEIQASLSSLPKNYYVKEIRYNGAVTQGDIFVINPSAVSHEIEIVCSDRAAALSGTVRNEQGQAVVDAKVLLTPWPADVIDSYPYGVAETTTDASGSFVFSRLRPGTYRAIAVPGAVRPSLEKPGRLLSLLQSVESVEIKDGLAVFKNLLIP